MNKKFLMLIIMISVFGMGDSILAMDLFENKNEQSITCDKELINLCEFFEITPSNLYKLENLLNLSGNIYFKDKDKNPLMLLLKRISSLYVNGYQTGGYNSIIYKILDFILYFSPVREDGERLALENGFKYVAGYIDPSYVCFPSFVMLIFNKYLPDENLRDEKFKRYFKFLKKNSINEEVYKDFNSFNFNFSRKEDLLVGCFASLSEQIKKEELESFEKNYQYLKDFQNIKKKYFGSMKNKNKTSYLLNRQLGLK